MRKYYLGAFLALSIFLMPTANAQEIKLTEDTALVPQGWSVSDEDLKFKENTTAVLNDNGDLIIGTLDSTVYLLPTGWKNIINDYYVAEQSSYFYPRFFRRWTINNEIILPTYGHVSYKRNTKVTFDENGTVLSGTINQPVTIKLQENKYGYVTFKEDNVLNFYANGFVENGTLDKDTKLRPVGWENNLKENAGFVKFKANSPIKLSKEGYVVEGTLKEDLSWIDKVGNTTTYKKNTVVKFN